MLARRTLLLAGAGLTAGLAAPAIRRAKAEPARALRIGYIFSTNSQFGAGAAVLADEVAKRTSGRIVVQQFPDAALGGDVELLKGVQLGSVDLAFVSGMGLPAILPEADIFHIPFLFNSVQHAHAVFDGPIGEEYRKLLSTKGLVALAWGENGMRHITNSKRPVAAPDDLKGLTMRVPQSDVMVAGFKAMGVDARQLAFPKLYEALQSGLFDAEENPIVVIRAAKFDQVQKFLSLSGHVYDPAIVVMSSDAFDELSVEDRAVFTDAARLCGEASRKYAADADRTGVTALKQAGMQVLTDIDRGRFASAMAAAQPEFEKRFGRSQIERIQRFT
jgi:tripartite ATP-independent transporter DctP family solute receptor